MAHCVALMIIIVIIHTMIIVITIVLLSRIAGNDPGRLPSGCKGRPAAGARRDPPRPPCPDSRPLAPLLFYCSSSYCDFMLTTLNYNKTNDL